VIDIAENPQIRYDKDEQLINDPTQDESVRQQARFRQAFWKARFKRQKKSDFIADGFVGLWMNMVINSVNGGRLATWREIEKFFQQPMLLDAILCAGESAAACLQAELTDSARIYFITCKTDSNYGSNLLGFVKLKEKEIANKTARDAAKNILAPLIHIKRPDYSSQMIKAVWTAWQLVFTDFPLMLDEKIRELDADTSRQISEIITGD